jgi:adenine-specific DNA-methyltransferase
VAVSEWTVHTGDCLEVMAGMEANAFDAIVTDPPYYRVKGDDWDRQWDKPEKFLAWLGEVADQWHRLLKPNGSLYCFASPQMAARAEVMLGERFDVLNRITWAKPDPCCEINKGAGGGGRQCKESLRAFWPRTESIIFAEHKGSDNIAKGEAGYAAKCDELRGFLFEPLRAYLEGEWSRAGLTFEDARQAVGCATGSGLPGHWFTRSQWALPTRDNYAKLQAWVGSGFLRREWDDLKAEYDDLKREYDDLKREYDDLKAEYDDLRRPFSVSAEVPYTDVWTFPTVQHYPGKHPCEKPQALLRHIITASTREGAVVLDSFAGTGSTGLACRDLGRSFVGIEKDEKYARTARARIAAVEPMLIGGVG